MLINLEKHDIFAALIHRAQYGGPLGSPASKLPFEALDVPGLTDIHIRHFLNILCEDCNYLEVGSLLGASLISAAWDNGGCFWGVDDFSEWSTVQELLATGLELQGNVLPIVGMQMADANRMHRDQMVPHVNFHEGSFRDFDLGQLEAPLDVFYYDADHSTRGTMEGILHFAPAFADQVILLVDDWESREVRAGVQMALAQIPFELETMFQPKWWNGFLVAALVKIA